MFYLNRVAIHAIFATLVCGLILYILGIGITHPITFILGIWITHPITFILGILIPSAIFQWRFPWR